MLRPGSSTRSEEQAASLEDECRRLHFLIAELLRKNQELRSQVAQLQSAHHLE
jgi:dihydropteroate synthase